MSKLWYLIRTASVKQGYKLCRGAGGGEEDKPTEFSKQERIFEQAAFLWLSTEIWEQGRGNDVLIRYETGLWAAFCITLAKRGGRGVQKLQIKVYRLLCVCELPLKVAHRSSKVDLNGLDFPYRKCKDPSKAACWNGWLMSSFSRTGRDVQGFTCLPPSA